MLSGGTVVKMKKKANKVKVERYFGLVKFMQMRVKIIVLLYHSIRPIYTLQSAQMFAFFCSFLPLQDPIASELAGVQRKLMKTQPKME